MSLYTGRGCRSRCTFCLWPQTIAGHAYRTRSVENVLRRDGAREGALPAGARVLLRRRHLHRRPPARRGDRARPRQARHHLVVQREGERARSRRSKVLRDNGLRLLLVGFESGNQEILNNIRKGTRIDRARAFAEDCHQLGILLHGTFILGLPGETRETIERTHRVREGDRPLQPAGLARGALSGDRALPRRRSRRGWLRRSPEAPAEGLVESNGFQEAVLGFDGPAAVGDARRARALLPRVLLPPAADPAHRARHAARPRGDAAAAARGPRVLLLHGAAARRARAPSRMPGELVVTGDDFGASREVNEAVEAAHRDGMLTDGEPDGRRARLRGRSGARARVPELATGLHLVLCDGRAASAASAGPALVGCRRPLRARARRARASATGASGARSAASSSGSSARSSSATSRAGCRSITSTAIITSTSTRSCSSVLAPLLGEYRVPCCGSCDEDALGRGRAAAPARPGARDLRGARAARAPARGRAGAGGTRASTGCARPAAWTSASCSASCAGLRAPTRRDLLAPEPRDASRAGARRTRCALGAVRQAREGRGLHAREHAHASRGGTPRERAPGLGRASRVVARPVAFATAGVPMRSLR